MTGSLRTAVDVARIQAEPGVGGMPSRRLFTPDDWRAFNPFLYMVHFGPRDIRETDWGFGPHPHRGFETVTYMLDGALEHRDSFGGEATLGPGDTQWMTAGAGIIHSEIPPEGFRKAGGIVEGFQIWLNLPKASQRTTPDFQVLMADDRPVVRHGGAEVVLLAGEVFGARSPITTHSPLLLAHIRLAPGETIEVPVPSDQSASAYFFKGPRTGLLTVWQQDGERLSLAGDATAREELLLLSGARLDQDVASYGPFVMSSRQEIEEAIDDYNAGRLGTPAQRTEPPTAGSTR